MPSLRAEALHVTLVENRLHENGLEHLRARKHGSTVVVESGPSDNPVKHLRLRRDTSTLWLLDFANHRGRWEHTPFRAPIPELVEMTITQLPWTVADQF